MEHIKPTPTTKKQHLILIFSFHCIMMMSLMFWLHLFCLAHATHQNNNEFNGQEKPLKNYNHVNV
jgi:hypothetical protein